MIALSLLFLFASIVVICLIVFGGGQVFIPLFSWLWQTLNQIGGTKHISDEVIDSVITIANLTPGVVSTKFATISGYLIANNYGWGIAAMFITYLLFVLPAILMVIISFKLLAKVEGLDKFKKIILFCKPAIAGIMIALGIQLMIGILFPYVKFNAGFSEYIKYMPNNQKNNFFSGWRQVALYIWVPINFVVSFVFYRKGFSIFYLLLISIVVSLIVFEPWL